MVKGVRLRSRLLVQVLTTGLRFRLERALDSVGLRL